MAAATNLGTMMAISFGSFAYLGFLPDDGGVTWSKPAGNTEVITDEDGATQSKIIMDPGQAMSLDLFIEAGSIIPPAEGDTIAVTDPAGGSISGMVVSAEASFSRGVTKLSVEIIQEDSMAYS